MPEHMRWNTVSQKTASVIAEVGGLPEIEIAAVNLRVAIDMTRQDINMAQLASRFLREPSSYFTSLVDTASLTATSKDTVADEGEGGYKRAQLGSRLGTITYGLEELMRQLVELRADLHFSQDEL